MLEHTNNIYQSNIIKKDIKENNKSDTTSQNNIAKNSAWLNVSGDIDDFIFYDTYTQISGR